MARHRADIVYRAVPGFRPLALDLYVGEGTTRAVCVFLHGGGWRVGSRREGPGPVVPESDRWFHRMADRGLAVASIDYRLSGEARYPAQLDDVAAGCRFVVDCRDELGIPDVPITLWGVSAGAHLAAMGALASSVADDVVGVACWSAPSDLAALADDVDAVGGVGERGTEARESMLLGVPVGDSGEAVRAASPVASVRSTSTRFQLVHGTADVHVPVAQSERFAAALGDARVPLELVLVEGADHFYSTIEPERLAELVDRSTDFLIDCARRQER